MSLTCYDDATNSLIMPTDCCTGFYDGSYEAIKETHRCYEQFKKGEIMKSIYDELLERVANGESFHIDFEKRNMKVGKQYLIKDGEYDIERELIQFEDYGNGFEFIMKTIYQLYLGYKYSTPSERSECKRKKYFKGS